MGRGLPLVAVAAINHIELRICYIIKIKIKHGMMSRRVKVSGSVIPKFHGRR